MYPGPTPGDGTFPPDPQAPPPTIPAATEFPPDPLPIAPPPVPLRQKFTVTDANGNETVFYDMQQALLCLSTLAASGNKVSISSTWERVPNVPISIPIDFGDLGRGAGAGPTVGLNGCTCGKDGCECGTGCGSGCHEA